MKLFYILLLVILFASCDVSLMDSGENTFPTPVPVPSYDGLHPYEPASVGSVVTEGRLVEVPYGFSQMSDEQILSLCYPSVSEFLGKGFLAVLFEALGVDDDSILSSDYVTARSRSVTFNAELHALDEGVVVWKGYDEKAYVDLDFLDVIAECTSPSAVRFLLKFIDGDEWNYSSNDANVSGSFGLSLDAGIRKAGSDSDEVPEVELKGYLDTSFSSVFLDVISMKVNGNDLEIHFPDQGLITLQGGLSIASSNLSIRGKTDGSLPDLDGSEGEEVITNYYCPYMVYLDIDRAENFDAGRIFPTLKELLTSSGGLGLEVIWNRLESLIWGSSAEDHITLGIEIMDDGTGKSRYAKLSDWALLQLLFF